MTSGFVLNTSVSGTPSVSSKSAGVWAPRAVSFSWTQGITPSPSSSPHVAFDIPTGATPRASGTS